MQNDQLQTLFDNLKLGRVVVGPEKVSGGLLHRMWRVTTESGLYAVKHLNPEIMSRPNIEDIYILSEKIASAYASQGIPAIPAIVHNGSPLHKCGHDTVMIYKWFDGVPAVVGSIDPNRNFKIGAIIAALHQYQPEIEGLDRPAFTGFDEKHWHDLLKQAREKSASWIMDFEKVISEIIVLSSEYSHATNTLSSETLISHRDMDQKNVLWTDDNKPLIIDWEAAGMTNPAMELFDMALNWSGMAKTDEGLDAFASFIRGYKSVRKAPETDAKAAFLGIIGNWLEWIEYNMRRSVGDQFDDEDKSLGAKEVSSTLKTVMSLHSRSEQLVNLYESSLMGSE